MFTALLIALVLVQAYAIAYMAWDHSYGCLTRAAFNVAYPVLRTLGYKFIFGDVDKFKSLNSQYGHERVNAMVKDAIRAFTRSGDIVFRVYSGDEFVVATRSNNPMAIIFRLCAVFNAHGMSLTAEIVEGSLDTASLKVLARKTK